jgi:hypothetical protein
VDKATLLADRVSLNTKEVPIEGVGTILVRGLSRFEFMVAQKKYPDDVLAQERFILSKAMLDPGDMTEADIEAWQKASGPMEINDVAMVVNKLSGITPEAAKEAYKSLRDGSEPGV